MLRVLNRELDADFDVEAFDHARAVGPRSTSGSRCGCGPTADMTVRVRDLDLTVTFAEGEEMRTEISAKFRPGGVRGWLEATGFEVTRPGPTSGRLALTLATAA